MKALQSLLQIKSGARNTQVVEMTLAAIKKLARKHKSLKLAQLASKISTVIAYGGNDVFKQVKEMILKDIEALKKEAEEDATEKAYCDEELAKTEAKKVELDADIEKLVAKIDQATSQSAQLKEEVAEAQESLVAITKGQAEMDTKPSPRGKHWSASMMQQPVKPVSHSKSSGSGGSIIDILEVCEADFSKDLAVEAAAESDALESYDKQTQENKIEKTTKDQDVKYKTQAFKALE